MTECFSLSHWLELQPDVRWEEPLSQNIHFHSQTSRFAPVFRCVSDKVVTNMCILIRLAAYEREGGERSAKSQQYRTETKQTEQAKIQNGSKILMSIWDTNNVLKVNKYPNNLSGGRKSLFGADKANIHKTSE